MARCWLVGVGLVAWTPGPLAYAASSSTLPHLVPIPRPAQARALDDWAAGRLGSRIS